MKLQKPLKAVILAAGSKSITEDGLPVLLQDLGGKKIIDYVMENVAQLIGPAETYVIVGYHQDAIRAHLGPDYHYVTQEIPQGTGDAVLALHPLLKDYDGDLLILYGDTPLFNPTSIRGLINRHRLRNGRCELVLVIRPQRTAVSVGSADDHVASRNAGCLLDFLACPYGMFHRVLQRVHRDNRHLLPSCRKH